MMPSGLAFWTLQLASTYIIMAFGTTADVGVYGVATPLLDGGQHDIERVFHVVHGLCLPESQRRSRRPEILRRHTQHLLRVLHRRLLVGSLLGKEIIGIMAAPEYAGAAMLLPGLMLDRMFYGLNQISSYGLSITKKPVYLAGIGVCRRRVLAGGELCRHTASGASRRKLGIDRSYALLFALTTPLSPKKLSLPLRAEAHRASPPQPWSPCAPCAFPWCFRLGWPRSSAGTLALCFSFRKSLRQARGALESMVHRKKEISMIATNPKSRRRSIPPPSQEKTTRRPGALNAAYAAPTTLPDSHCGKRHGHAGRALRHVQGRCLRSPTRDPACGPSRCCRHSRT